MASQSNAFSAKSVLARAIGRHPVLALVLLLGALAIVKVGFLVAYGPTIMPDSSGYTEFADFILAGRLAGPGLTEGDFPATLFRIAGYPAVIAAAKIVAGDHALWLVALVQFAVSLVATIFVYRLARGFGLGTGLALLAAAAQATSLPLSLDQVIITDSLNGSILTIATCALAGAILTRRLSVAAAIGSGIALAAAFLLREATLFLAIGFLPLACAAAFAHRFTDGNGEKTREPLWRGTVKLVCILAPLLLVQQAYREWNRARVGVPIITTAAQTAILAAVAQAARVDPAIFSRDTPLDRVARTTLRTYDFTEIRQINQRLYKEFGRSAIQTANEAYVAYFRAWREHPAAMLTIPFPALREWQMRLAVRPMASVRELILWNRGDDQNFASERAVRGGQWWMAPAVALNRVSQVMAILVFAAFLVLTPWRACREGIKMPANCAALGIWILYLSFFTLYAFVHLEQRYLAPVIAGSLVLGTVNLLWLYRSAASKK